MSRATRGDLNFVCSLDMTCEGNVERRMSKWESQYPISPPDLYTSIPLYLYTSIPLYLHTSIPLYLYTSIPLHPSLTPISYPPHSSTISILRPMSWLMLRIPPTGSGCQVQLLAVTLVFSFNLFSSTLISRGLDFNRSTSLDDGSNT